MLKTQFVSSFCPQSPKDGVCTNCGGKGGLEYYIYIYIYIIIYTWYCSVKCIGTFHGPDTI